MFIPLIVQHPARYEKNKTKTNKQKTNKQPNKNETKQKYHTISYLTINIPNPSICIFLSLKLQHQTLPPPVRTYLILPHISPLCFKSIPPASLSPLQVPNPAPHTPPCPTYTTLSHIPHPAPHASPCPTYPTLSHIPHPVPHTPPCPHYSYLSRSLLEPF